MMKNRQMLYLFFCNFAVFITGGALLPLLPLYATELGGTPTVVGFYLAAMYFAIAVGTMLPGWLARRVSRKRLFLAAGVTGVPVLVLHALVSQLWQAIPLTIAVWFCGGIGTALVSVLIGLHADTHHRGRSFGLMFLARPLGGVLGSLLAGQLVEWWGYPLLFVTLSMIWAGWPVIGLLILKDEPGPSVPPRAERVVHKVSGQVESAFYLLVLAAFLSTTVVYTGRLGVSLSMQMLSFSPRAVAATSAVGALITIPIVLVLGTLSDRLGRKGLLLLSYLLAAGGVVILSIATQFWQFGLTMVLLMAVTSANGSVATALATDLLGPNNLSKGLSWLNATTWLGGVLGFAGAGYALDRLGVTTLYLVTAVLAITAAVLVGGFGGRWWVIRSNLSAWKHPKVIPASKKV